jgi:hypothetical protein
VARKSFFANPLIFLTSHSILRTLTRDNAVKYLVVSPRDRQIHRTHSRKKRTAVKILDFSEVTSRTPPQSSFASAIKRTSLKEASTLTTLRMDNQDKDSSESAHLTVDMDRSEVDDFHSDLRAGEATGTEDPFSADKSYQNPKEEDQPQSISEDDASEEEKSLSCYGKLRAKMLSVTGNVSSTFRVFLGNVILIFGVILFVPLSIVVAPVAMVVLAPLGMFSQFTIVGMGGYGDSNCRMRMAFVFLPAAKPTGLRVVRVVVVVVVGGGGGGYENFFFVPN